MDDDRGATECLRCDGSLTSVGVEQFRVGGTSGGWKLVFGDLAELGEGKISFEILACGSCGYVELRNPGFAPVEGSDPWSQVWAAHDRRTARDMT